MLILDMTREKSLFLKSHVFTYEQWCLYAILVPGVEQQKDQTHSYHSPQNNGIPSLA